MTWYTDDASVSDSAPADLYTFTSPSVTYRYTSAPADVTYAANVYTALAGLSRSTLGGGSVVDPPELVVDMPISAAVAQAFAFGRAPRDLSFTLLTLQPVSGVALERWRGKVSSFATLGRTTKARIPLLVDDAFTGVIGSMAFQALCGHPLYSDSGLCGANRDDFDYASTIATVNGANITVASIVGQADQYFQSGEIRRDSDGEKRYILSQIGTEMILDAPFPTLAVGNVVTFWAGCNHTIQTCYAKFGAAVVKSFGGHPYIGDVNPFITSSWWRYF